VRAPVFFILATLSIQAAFGQPYRHPVLDSLVAHVQVGGGESNLIRIDKALRDAGPNAPPRLAYFLHRYRCEQLYYQGLFNESMIDAAKARRIAEELQDSLLIASSLNQVAVLLEEQDDNRQAIALLRDALRWYPVTSVCTYPITQPHRIHGNLGRCWANLGALDSARASEERSLHLAVRANVPRGTALALLELGRLQLRTDQADSALQLFDRAIDTAAAHAIHDVLLDGLGVQAEALVRTSRTGEAQLVFERAHAMIQEHPDIAQRSVVAFHDREVRLLAEAGLFRDALAASRTWRTLDSALRSSSARTAQRILANLHATDAELAWERSRAELAAAEVRAELRIRRTVQVGSIVALLLLAALVVTYIGRGRQKDRLERLALQRLELDRQIADLRIRQQVGEDLHDDLGAGLSALKLHCELAEDLSTDAAARSRNRTLSRIAGDLIAGMRHILWSLHHTEATAQDTATYVADRTRAFCAEHDRPVRLTMPSAWPDLVPDAELRHLAWVLVKESLKVMVTTGPDVPVELTMSWNNGLALAITMQGAARATDRTALASALSTHHLRVSRIGGSLRTVTEGPLRAEAFLPSATASGPKVASAPVLSGIAMAFILVLLGLASPFRTKAQDHVRFRSAILDSLFSSASLHAAHTTRLRAINTAIDRLDPNSSPRLECHLLLSRANQMYYQGLYDAGINDVNRSLALAQELHDSLLIATSFNMFGLLNDNLGNDAVTLPWFQLAERWLPQDTRCDYPVVKDYHIDGNIARCLLNMGQVDSAEFHYHRSRTRAAEIGNRRAMALANIGLARILLRRNRPEAAEILLDSASSQALRDGSRDVYVNALTVLAEVRMRRFGGAEGARILDEAIAFIRSDSTITPVSRRNFFKQASLLREALGQYEAAMADWRRWQREDSAIHARDDRASLATLKIMLDNDQRLLSERAERERTLARLLLDREQRRIMITAAGISALLLLGVLLLYTGRQRNQRRMTALERDRSLGRKELAELRVRQRLSEEMHQELGAGLDALKLRSELALEVEPDPSDRERIATIAVLAGELVGSLRQIIWALDTGRSSLEETVHYTTHYARTYAAQQGLPIDLHIGGPWPDVLLTMEQRRNCFLVVKEALHNIVKHAHATQVGLRITLADGLVVEIADDGRGTSPSSDARNGNGLRNMRKRIEAIGGRFRMEQRNGTMIHFTVPLVNEPDNLRSTDKPRG